MVWDEKRGWNELSLPADISTAQEVIPAKSGFKILVRRIRGSAGGEWNLTKYDGSADTTLETVPSGGVDIPGLELETDEGDSVRADGSTNSVTDAAVKVQYAYKRVFEQRVR